MRDGECVLTHECNAVQYEPNPLIDMSNSDPWLLMYIHRAPSDVVGDFSFAGFPLKPDPQSGGSSPMF